MCDLRIQDGRRQQAQEQERHCHINGLGIHLWWGVGAVGMGQWCCGWCLRVRGRFATHKCVSAAVLEEAVRQQSCCVGMAVEECV
jgi:hypothetical protein